LVANLFLAGILVLCLHGVDRSATTMNQLPPKA
jgi:hypothetical protein